MQLPFYSEFRLPRCTHAYVCVCNRDTRSIYPSIDLFLSVANSERILGFSTSCFNLSFPSLSPSAAILSFFLHRVSTISLSPMILLPGDASKVTGTRVSIAHRRTYTCWTDLPLGHSSDTFTSVKRHAHMDMA